MQIENKKLKEQLEELKNGKLSGIRVKTYNFGSITVPANGTLSVKVELVPDEGYRIISSVPVCAFTSNLNILFGRARTVSGEYFVIYKNVSASEQEGNAYAHFLEVKK